MFPTLFKAAGATILVFSLMTGLIAAPPKSVTEPTEKAASTAKVGPNEKTPTKKIEKAEKSDSDSSPAADSETPEAETRQRDEPQPPDSSRVTVEAARERAKLMHDIYAVTLEVMHDRYFHGDRAMVPARAMEDVFEEMQRHSETRARWISVNLKPMSLDHKPESEFEKRAASEISRGETTVEAVEDGYYRSATAIPLTSGCVSCHGGFFSKPSDKPKFAGLVISVPVHKDSAPIK
jgi:hypothetical protein